MNRKEFLKIALISPLALNLGCGMRSAIRRMTVRERITIAEGGRSDYKIVISRDASPSEKHAAEELKGFLKQMTGADLPILTDDAEMGEKEIILGRNRHLDGLNLKVDWDELGDEGFRICTVNPHLVIAGGRLRGTMYGVYTFLEHLGCRWFAPGVSRIPRMERVDLASMDETQVPILEYREPFYTEAFDGDWAARNKANGSTHRLDENRGGKIKYSHFVHTFYSIIPPDKYFKDHPEYFSEIEGRRTADHAQLCLTNPDVLRITIETVRRWIEESPDAMIFSVSQNDWGNWCRCPECRKVDEEEGSHSGTVIRFVNKVAEAIERDYPDKFIDTLAYQYTRKPPKHVKPRKNVIVRLCSIECCFSHPLDECPEDRSFVDDIRGWSKITDRLYVWDYVTNFAHYIMPFPNLFSLKPNVKFFVEHSVRGIFEEGNYSGGGNGEFAALRAYMLAKILWNPDCDEGEVMEEFLEGYYGKAAPFIKDYIELIHGSVLDKGIHFHIFDPPAKLDLSDETIAEAERLFDEAERAVGDEDTLMRVKVARLPIWYVRMETAERLTPELERIAAEFFDVAAKSSITNISEGRSMDWYRDAVRKRWDLEV
jgi:hypothetical protein